MTKISSLNKMALLSLGALTALSAMAIDMYLPAFGQVAQSFSIDFSQVPLTLYIFLTGLAIGQAFYGPLIDSFGRKKILILGICIFISGSIFVVLAQNFHLVLLARFIQALGAASASVIPRVIVVDIYEEKTSAKIFSFFMQILAIAPILAPMFGVYLLKHFGWQSIFIIQSLVALIFLILTFLFVQETLAKEDREIFTFKSNIKDYLQQSKNLKFLTYSLASGFAFASLFMYISSSPFIFMEYFHFNDLHYTYIFASAALLMIIFNQVNIILLKFYRPLQLLHYGLLSQVILSFLLALFIIFNFRTSALYILFICLIIGSLAFISGNITAVTMKSSKQNGVSSSIYGLIQFGISATMGVILTGINSLFADKSSVINILLLPLSIVFASSLAYFLVRRNSK